MVGRVFIFLFIFVVPAYRIVCRVRIALNYGGMARRRSGTSGSNTSKSSECRPPLGQRHQPPAAAAAAASAQLQPGL